jgi:hypothetical protein
MSVIEQFCGLVVGVPSLQADRSLVSWPFGTVAETIGFMS